MDPSSSTIDTSTNEGQPNDRIGSEEFQARAAEALAKDDASRAANRQGEPDAGKTEEKPAPSTDEPDKGASSKTEEEPPPHIKSAKGVEDWQRLRTERSKLEERLKKLEPYQQEAETLRAELEKTKAAIPPDYDAIKKENQALSDRLRLIAIEQHPRFKAYYEPKIEAAINIAKSLAGDDGEKVAKLMRTPDSEEKNAALDDILSNLAPSKAARLGAALSDLDRLNAERASEVARAQNDYAQLEKLEAQEMEKAKVARQTAFDSSLSTIQGPEKGLAIYQGREGDDGWNQGVSDRIALARAIHSGELNPEDSARAALWAAAAPAFLQQSLALTSELNALRKELADLKGAQPRIDGGDVSADQHEPKATGDYLKDAERRAAEFLSRR